jgi:hypothetical protein
MRTGLIVAALMLVAAVPAAAKDDSRRALIARLGAIADARLEARAAEIAKIATPAAADARKAWVRARILQRIGGLPPRTAPLAAKVTGRFAGQGFRVEKVMFDAMPGQHITANLFVPTASKGPVHCNGPAVLVINPR